MLNQFLLYLEAKGNRPRTIETYRQRLRLFLDYLNTEGEEITPEEIDRWVVSMRRRGLAVATINNRIKDVKFYFRWQQQRGYIKQSPANHLTTRRNNRRTIKAMDAVDLERMIATAEKAANGRDAAMLKFIASTGCRVGEMVSINLDHLNLKHREVHAYGKTGWRCLLFNVETKFALERWLQNRPAVNHNSLFTAERQPYRPITTGAVYQAFRRIAAQSNVTGPYNPHSIRHLVGQIWSDQHNLEATRQKLGHADISTTAIYANQDKSRLKKFTDKTKIF